MANKKVFGWFVSGVAYGNHIVFGSISDSLETHILKFWHYNINICGGYMVLCFLFQWSCPFCDPSLLSGQAWSVGSLPESLLGAKLREVQWISMQSCYHKFPLDLLPPKKSPKRLCCPGAIFVRPRGEILHWGPTWFGTSLTAGPESLIPNVGLSKFWRYPNMATWGNLGDFRGYTSHEFWGSPFS